VIRIGLRALFALFALVVCAGHASQAQAACGDWLAYSDRQTVHDQQTAPVQAPPRCSGRSCRQSPTDQPRSPLSAERIVIDKVALTAESLTDLIADSRDRFAKPVSDRRPPNLFSSLLLRPPRRWNTAVV